MYRVDPVFLRTQFVNAELMAGPISYDIQQSVRVRLWKNKQDPYIRTDLPAIVQYGADFIALGSM